MSSPRRQPPSPQTYVPRVQRPPPPEQVRHPLDFANSMLSYSKSIGVHEWVGVWLHYMTHALNSCKAHPLALVSHSELVRQPRMALRALHDRLTALGVTLPSLDAEVRLQSAAPRLHVACTCLPPTRRPLTTTHLPSPPPPPPLRRSSPTASSFSLRHPSRTFFPLSSRPLTPWRSTSTAS